MSGSTHERWDIVLRFLNGPLALQGELVLRGPVVRMGAKPGPGELELSGYRGLDERQAVITAYDAGTASIAPVGKNQVRLAPHEHVDWDVVQPLRGPAHLTPGCAIHLGPPGRGASAVFVDCRRLGVWEQRAILSEAQTQPESTEVKEVSSASRVPIWFLPALFGMFGLFATTLGIMVFLVYQRPWDRIGPVDEGSEQQDIEALADATQLNDRILDGVGDPYLAFVMKPNARVADWPELVDARPRWDAALMREVAIRESALARQWSVWRMFDRSVAEYADVLERARAAGLPDAVAAIPFQESAYRRDPTSPVCAKGWWQFMPETALRAGLQVQACTLAGTNVPWSPKELAPPMNAYREALYVQYDPGSDRSSCRIRACEVDERTDLIRSTNGAMKLLGAAWEDPDVRTSGSAVQLLIASHNAGFDDAPYRNGKTSQTQILPAWRGYKKAKNVARDPAFFGNNLTCRRAQDAGQPQTGKSCGGVLWRETQNYVPLILAYQFLAACYYGKNYDDYPALKPYTDFVVGDGYCKAIAVPSRDEVQSRPQGGR